MYYILTGIICFIAGIEANMWWNNHFNPFDGENNDTDDDCTCNRFTGCCDHCLAEINKDDEDNSLFPNSQDISIGYQIPLGRIAKPTS